MNGLFHYPPGTTLFRATDPDMLPVTVKEMVISPDHRRHLATVHPFHGGPAVWADPHHLVHTDETLRPTREQLRIEKQRLTLWITGHSDACDWCSRSQFWATAHRCGLGKRAVHDLVGADYYLSNVWPWLEGCHVDPALLRSGQRLAVRDEHGNETLRGVFSNIDNGQWVDAGEDGMILLRHGEDPPTRHPVHTVFHLP
ncbi:hypothetical protein [Streptomyces sp. CS014]|uniref:hypothetical protein n=1 Tax=Streptomyces sp. CS014 TaxID=2162707 RepID=UPI0013A5AB2E|nr:hypothetical protein [Streptomyces sp. CS014]